jgi:hypothetical protein
MWVMRAFLRLVLLTILCATAVEVGSPPLAGPTQSQSFEEQLSDAQDLLEKNESEKALKAFNDPFGVEIAAKNASD